MTKARFGRQSLMLALVLSASTATLHAQENVRPTLLPAPGTPVPVPAASQPSQPAGWGLGTYVHPLQTDGLTCPEQAQLIAPEQKEHVHFFLINGFDPAYCANLNGVAAYFRDMGFANTHCYQFTTAWLARRQIEEIRGSDPQARIVLLGFSFGANFARNIANHLEHKGVYIDCLIYLGGDTIFNTQASRPGNVGQIVNITGHGLVLLGRDMFLKGDDIDGAVNMRLDARHYSLPCQTETINAIGQAVLAAAAQPTVLPTARAPASVLPSASLGRPELLPARSVLWPGRAP